MGGSRLRITLRRVIAVMVLAGLGVTAWFVLARDGADEADERNRARGLSAGAANLARGLSRSEQVDQVLLVGFDGTGAAAGTAGPGFAAGGVLVGPQNWIDRSQGAALIRSLRAAGAASGGIPPLIVGAQEGGVYRSFTDVPPSERQLDIGDEGSTEATQAWATGAAAELEKLGFDLNLFPVADVATLDSPLADRAFSDDPATVAALTAAAVRGCDTTGLACAPLHFPGLGAASQDTSQGPATVSLDAAGLADRDLEPFRAAIAEGARALVLSVALYSAYDAVTPGAFTPEIADGLLRDRLGFTGLAISDDLGSGAVKATHSVPDAAVAALAAGTDMVQIGSPADLRGAREAIGAAVTDGRLAPERLAEAAGRVLDLKRDLGLIE